MDSPTPKSSPILHALIATPKVIDAEQRVLKNKLKQLMPATDAHIERLGDLVIYNPTLAQRTAIICHVKAALARLEERFENVPARQTSLDIGL